jgi:hypothetical protein
MTFFVMHDSCAKSQCKYLFAVDELKRSGSYCPCAVFNRSLRPRI